MWPYLEMGLDRGSQFKTRSLDQIQYDCVLMTKGSQCTKTDTCRGRTVRRHGVGTASTGREHLRPPETGERQGTECPSLPSEGTTQPMPVFFSLQNHGTIHFCFFKPLSVWYFVKAASGNEYSQIPRGVWREMGLKCKESWKSTYWGARSSGPSLTPAVSLLPPPLLLPRRRVKASREGEPQTLWSPGPRNGRGWVCFRAENWRLSGDVDRVLSSQD